MIWYFMLFCRVLAAPLTPWVVFEGGSRARSIKGREGLLGIEEEMEVG